MGDEPGTGGMAEAGTAGAGTAGAGTASDAAAEWGAVAEAWDTRGGETEEPQAAATDALVAAVAVRPGDRVLEIAAGPGVLAERWSALAGPSGTVLVTDVAPAMVEAARRRTAELGNVDVAVVDAAAMDLPDGSFDAVASRMGLMFAPDPGAALAEIRRVLAPGGRVGALVWGALEDNPWLACVGMAAAMTGVVNGGPPVGPGGVFSLGDAERLAELARGAGLADVAVQAFDLCFPASSLDEHLDRVGQLAGPLAGALAAATDEQRAAVRDLAAQVAEPHRTDDGYALPGRALLLTAHT